MFSGWRTRRKSSPNKTDESIRRTTAIINKTLWANLAVCLLGIVIAGFSGVLLYELGGEIASAFFLTPRVGTVDDLVGVNVTLEAEVTGFVDTEKIMVEESWRRGSTEVAWHKYYYAVFDQDRIIGIYVYSNLDPDDFMRLYSKGPVVLRGIWEETPRDIRIQEPMSHVREQMMEVWGRGFAPPNKDDLMQSLPAYRRRAPLRADRRLNLNMLRWKLEKAVSLAGTVFFFVVGIVMIWTGVKRRVQPV